MAMKSTRSIVSFVFSFLFAWAVGFAQSTEEALQQYILSMDAKKVGSGGGLGNPGTAELLGYPPARLHDLRDPVVAAPLDR